MEVVVDHAAYVSHALAGSGGRLIRREEDGDVSGAAERAGRQQPGFVAQRRLAEDELRKPPDSIYGPSTQRQVPEGTTPRTASAQEGERPSRGESIRLGGARHRAAQQQRAPEA